MAAVVVSDAIPCVPSYCCCGAYMHTYKSPICIRKRALHTYVKEHYIQMHAHVKEPSIRMILKFAEPNIRIYTYIQTYKSPVCTHVHNTHTHTHTHTFSVSLHARLRLSVSLVFLFFKSLQVTTHSHTVCHSQTLDSFAPSLSPPTCVCVCVCVCKRVCVFVGSFECT